MNEPTPITTTTCGHLEKLQEFGCLRFGMMINLETGKSRLVPMLDQLIESKTGRLSVTTKSSYITIQHCPICGESIPRETPQKPDTEAES